VGEGGLAIPKPSTAARRADRFEVVRLAVSDHARPLAKSRESGQRRRETASGDVEEARVWRAKGNSRRNGENRKARSAWRLRSCGRRVAVSELDGNTSRKRFGSPSTAPTRNPPVNSQTL
jgi:hypothetical protein